jgi:hypothetical protein
MANKLIWVVAPESAKGTSMLFVALKMVPHSTHNNTIRIVSSAQLK